MGKEDAKRKIVIKGKPSLGAVSATYRPDDNSVQKNITHKKKALIVFLASPPSKNEIFENSALVKACLYQAYRLAVSHSQEEIQSKVETLICDEPYYLTRSNSLGDLNVGLESLVHHKEEFSQKHGAALKWLEDYIVIQGEQIQTSHFIGFADLINNDMTHSRETIKHLVHYFYSSETFKETLFNLLPYINTERFSQAEKAAYYQKSAEDLYAAIGATLPETIPACFQKNPSAMRPFFEALFADAISFANRKTQKRNSHDKIENAYFQDEFQRSLHFLTREYLSICQYLEYQFLTQDPKTHFDCFYINYPGRAPLSFRATLNAFHHDTIANITVWNNYTSFSYASIPHWDITKQDLDEAIARIEQKKQVHQMDTFGEPTAASLGMVIAILQKLASSIHNHDALMQLVEGCQINMSISAEEQHKQPSKKQVGRLYFFGESPTPLHTLGQQLRSSQERIQQDSLTVNAPSIQNSQQ